MSIKAHPGAVDSINKNASSLIPHLIELKIGIAPAQKRTTKKAISVITDKDFVTQPIFSGSYEDGSPYIFFKQEGNKAIGFESDGISKMDALIEKLLKVPDIAATMSENSLEEIIYGWLRKASDGTDTQDFWKHFKEITDKLIRVCTVYIPLNGIEIEGKLEVSGVKLIDFDESYMQQWLDTARQWKKGNVEDFTILIDQMKTEMAGCAAIEIKLKAEPDYAHQAGIHLAEKYCTALRLFAPDRESVLKRSYFDLLSMTTTPAVHSIVIGIEKEFSYKSSSKHSGRTAWLIEHEDIQRMANEGAWTAINLAVSAPSDHSDFQQFVWRSISAFSKSLTHTSMDDRLAARIATVESILLRDGSESISQSVSDRMAFYLTTDPEIRREIVKNFKSVYRMRSDYVHHRRNSTDNSEIEYFGYTSWNLIRKIISDANNFKTRREFIELIENIRYGA